METKGKRIMLPMILVFIIIAGMLAISFYYLYSAIQAYSSGSLDEALYNSLLAVVGIGISFYITFIIRKRTLIKKPLPRVVTTIECQKCELKNLRTFEKGDYILKTVGNCQKCSEPMLITAIHTEEPKKQP